MEAVLGGTGLGIIIGLLALGLFIGIGVVIKKRLYRRFDDYLPGVLKSFEFVHEVLLGHGSHQVKGVKHNLWADAHYTVVILHHNKPSGLVGFELEKTILTVYQLQGIKGAYVGDIQLGDFLLAYAEVIARKLDMHAIRVQPAYRHVYFDLDEEHSLYPQLYKHQDRLRALYDQSAKARGFDRLHHGYHSWYVKVLRKPLTLKRFVRLQGILINRRLAVAYKSGAHDLFAQE